jgi:hypothetical protein
VSAARSRLAGAALAAAWVAGCAARPTPVGIPPPAVPAWELPAALSGRQTLFRAQYRGPRGDGSFRLVLRLADPSRYELAASDILGRQLWTLSVAGGEALFLDHRAARACRLSGDVRLPDLGLPPLALNAVPALLLGRLPAAPADPPAAGSYRDAAGRRWSFALRGGEPASWTLWDDEGPALFWSRQASGGVLSARREGAQLRWQASQSEPLAAPPAPPRVPPGFAEGGCDEPRMP